MPAPIDCIVIGYNDTKFDDLLERNAPFRSVSGGYRHLIANSVPFRGRRVKYCDLLNVGRMSRDSNAKTLHVGKMPNLGVCYLVSFLRKRSLRAEFVNFFNEERDRLRDLLELSPRCVAITTTFYFESEPIRAIADFVRSYSPSTRVVVGGPHVFNVCSDNSVEVQNTMFESMGADIFVFDSQGELTLSQLCLELRSSDPRLNLVPNVIYRDADGSFRRSLRLPENNDMDANVVDWTLFDESFISPTVQTRTARSCAYKCAFCRYPVMAGSLNLVSLEKIEQELDCLRAMGVRYLLFIDDTFNIPLKRFKDICRLMIRKQYGFKWFSYFRCANADHECFDLMAASGCTGVFLGIESGDDRILLSMNKVATSAKYAQGIQELNARDIVTYASFIVGFPPERRETAENTLAFIDATRPSFYCLETFFYDPKVPIATRAPEFGLTGRGYSWRHNTMDWIEASDIVEKGYRTITGSVVLPLYSFDLWSLAYLMGEGMSRDEITAFLREASRLMVRGLDGDISDAAGEERLLSVFAPPSPALT